MPIKCYICSVCNKVFYSEKEVYDCELNHKELNLNEKIFLMCQYNKEDICDYCDNSYYVYGCERDCSKKCKIKNKDNTENMFVPVEPLHNKSHSGGI